jgi:hypothetical protein
MAFSYGNDGTASPAIRCARLGDLGFQASPDAHVCVWRSTVA